MLDKAIQNQLKQTFITMTNQVTLQVNTDASKKAKELLTLAQDLAELSDHIRFEATADTTERQPLMQVRDAKNSMNIGFAGVPMGHEFTSLILAILHAGGHPLKLEQDQIEQIRSLQGDFHFETYISLSCQNCPEVVQALNLMAAVNPRISHVMIDGSVFQREVDERKIMAVPSTFLNGQAFSQGRIALAEILNRVDSGAAKRRAAKLNEQAPYDLLVIGGGPAGAASAIYSARKGIRTGVVTERFGGQVLDTVGIENFISVKKTEGPHLAAHLEEHVRDYDVDIITNQLGSKLIPAEREGGLISIELESGAVLQSRSMVLATGARWREMDVPGEKEYLGKGVAYCPHCDGPLFKGKRVAVIGGGNSGIEAAIDLAGIVEHVTVLEFDHKLRADEVLHAKARSLHNIDIITRAMTTEVIGNGEKVTGLHYTNLETQSEETLKLDGVFVQIGLMPNTEFLKETIELSDRGEIIVGPQGQTNVPGVFAAGDATTAPYKQIVIAMGSGATAALGAFDYMIRTPITSVEAA